MIEKSKWTDPECLKTPLEVAERFEALGFDVYLSSCRNWVYTIKVVRQGLERTFIDSFPATVARQAEVYLAGWKDCSDWIGMGYGGER